jgi:hypothetical protein
MTERLRMDGTGLGFFGRTPVGRPNATGSRQGNSALTSLVSALTALGLLTNGTS